MTCVKQALSPRHNCSSSYLLRIFSFVPHLIVTFSTLSPFYPPGDQMTLGLCSALPLRVNASLFSHSFIRALSHPFGLSFYFNAGFYPSRGQVRLIGYIIISY